ncbi:MAG: 23S rRNA (pseudouridine(1915)-N(3))-methyltransferase RlmH [Campylobacteraceae bacterium]|jgi:23S rRNA (pseudouridine1915-N3)-methyltransferase|nr:23S rRNA (pseudouridine(1915)-N(3))-methyltransferase RlmH [Campylobacteraceae bacterium]
MRISVYSIEKSTPANIKQLNNDFIKMSSKFAKVEEITLFNASAAKAQSKGAIAAKSVYSLIYEPYLKGYTIALDEGGEELTSAQFSSLFKNDADIRFFIGGAYGFEEQFLRRTKRVISLSRLTYAHKIAKLILFEQIYRGLCIKNNHPYHKD